MLVVLLKIICFPIASGFLLPKNNSVVPPNVGTTMTDQHYVFVMDLIGKERQLTDLYHHQMEQFVLSLQNKMKMIEDKIATSNSVNGSLQEKNISDMNNTIAKIQNELNQIKSENHVLKQENFQLRQDYAHLQHEIYTCGNDTLKLRQELECFTNSSDGQQFRNASILQASVDSLKHTTGKMNTKLESLTSTSNARSQDFLALLNQTLVSEKKIRVLETQLESSTKQVLSELDAYQNHTSLRLEKSFHMMSAMNKTVALTAHFNYGTFKANSVITLQKPTTVIGISDVNTLKSSGKFRCEVAGVYLFSTFIMTNAGTGYYNMYKNNDHISYVYFISGNNNHYFHTGTGVVVVDLNIGDHLYVKVNSYDMLVYSGESSMTVIKIR